MMGEVFGEKVGVNGDVWRMRAILQLVTREFVDKKIVCADCSKKDVERWITDVANEVDCFSYCFQDCSDQCAGSALAFGAGHTYTHVCAVCKKDVRRRRARRIHHLHREPRCADDEVDVWGILRIQIVGVACFISNANFCLWRVMFQKTFHGLVFNAVAKQEDDFFGLELCDGHTQ